MSKQDRGGGCCDFLTGVDRVDIFLDKPMSSNGGVSTFFGSVAGSFCVGRFGVNGWSIFLKNIFF